VDGRVLRCGTGAIQCGSRSIKVERNGPKSYAGYSGYIIEFGPPDYNLYHKAGPREGEYRIHAKDNVPLGLSGTFWVCAYARVSKDYNGVQQLLFSKFYDINGGPAGYTQGGFPTIRGSWEKICKTFNSGKIGVSSFELRLGYPLRNTLGSIQITGVSITLNPEITEAIEGVDVDAGDILTYTLTDKNIPFTINKKTGVLVVSGKLNFEKKPKYILNVMVTDKTGLKGYGVVEVNILNQNDPPVAYDAEFNIHEDAASGTMVGRSLLAVDEDATDKLSWSIVSGNEPSETGT
jgi:hypothetical protein